MISQFRGEYNWLSNMYSCKVVHKRKLFNSVENAYMFAKNDTCEDWLHFCLNNPPNICKKESKNIEIRADWEEVKLGIMYNLLLQKFKQEPFRTKLLATGNENIQEGNFWNDKFWGICLKSNPNEGENNLGRLIMYIRILLKQGKI